MSDAFPVDSVLAVDDSSNFGHIQNEPSPSLVSTGAQVPPMEPDILDESFNQAADAFLGALPYSPPNPSRILQGHDDSDFSPHLPIPTQEDEYLDVSPPSIGSLRGPEYRIQMLIETNRQLQQRSSQPLHVVTAARSDSGRAEEQLMQNILTSHRAFEASHKRRGHFGFVSAGGLECGHDRSADFECNICLDMAKDPVVSSCGHLFCWSCLYQWLHLHCAHNECPVCKGHLTDAKITPIFGRGNSDTSIEEKRGIGGVKIPPRPRGHRCESLRQQLQGADGLIHDRVRYEGGHLLSILDGARRMILDRLREWRMLRPEGNAESGPNTEGIELPSHNIPDPRTNTTSLLLRGEVDRLHQPSLHALDTLAAISSDLGRVVGSSQPETSTSLEAALATDQASASSTMAVIEGDIAVNDAPEVHVARRRRRARSSGPGSLDVDGGAFRAYTRRRTN